MAGPDLRAGAGDPAHAPGQARSPPSTAKLTRGPGSATGDEATGMLYAALGLEEDLGGQGVVAEDLEGAVLGQQGQGHQDAPTEQGRSGLGQGHPPEGAPARARPRERATSSWPGSAPRKEAATGR